MSIAHTETAILARLAAAMPGTFIAKNP